MAVLLLCAPGAARADVLRHAALTVLLVRENPTAEGRRVALDAAFDAALRAPEASAVPGGSFGPRRAWFPKRLAALEEDAARLRVPALPAAPPETTLLEETGSALRAALTPWRQLADAACGAAWSLVKVGLAQGPQR